MTGEKIIKCLKKTHGKSSPALVVLLSHLQREQRGAGRQGLPDLGRRVSHAAQVPCPVCLRLPLHQGLQTRTSWGCRHRCQARVLCTGGEPWGTANPHHGGVSVVGSPGCGWRERKRSDSLEKAAYQQVCGGRGKGGVVGVLALWGCQGDTGGPTEPRSQTSKNCFIDTARLGLAAHSSGPVENTWGVAGWLRSSQPRQRATRSPDANIVFLGVCRHTQPLAGSCTTCLANPHPDSELSAASVRREGQPGAVAPVSLQPPACLGC